MRQKGVKVLLATMVCTMMIGATAFAQTKTMPDGTVFDAEYYAEQNDDVKAAYGTDENLLYLHYSVWGKNEGRQPVGDTMEKTAPITAEVPVQEKNWIDQLYYDLENSHYDAVLQQIQFQTFWNKVHPYAIQDRSVVLEREGEDLPEFDEHDLKTSDGKSLYVFTYGGIGMVRLYAPVSGNYEKNLRAGDYWLETYCYDWEANQYMGYSYWDGSKKVDVTLIE
ncbi:MAG: hypothetical protein J6B10_04795 [Lachnospiraceae bacterium]|nr:hypothetical protein [Lachnospiraceae bacterium]